ncbi:MAG: hypothetical protein KDA69_17325 [Planctomycetaceae bacterium]|nr:hypothetical protein [Planctomycetaceae bacterium]MCA9046093.1 hypothetical protein [Planctomycetaceae bacterium]
MTDNVLARSDLRPLSEIAVQPPPLPAKLRRWHAAEICGIQIKTIPIGGRRYSTSTAFNEFVEALTAKPNRADCARSSASNTQRKELL